MTRNRVEQLHVVFEAEHDRDLRLLPKAKRALRRAVRERGLKTQHAPPINGSIPDTVFIDGVYRVIMFWMPAPAFGVPRWCGRVDTLATRG